jgi:3-oxoadipate enol-lactonase
MEIIERGAGDPLVVVPGIQGRWEYVGAAVEALAISARVITFPLCDEPAARAPFDPSRGIDTYADQIDAVLDERGIRRAAICGVSFGGLIALRFAARRPERVSALIMVSTPGPAWHLRRRHELYARLPWLFGPLFAVESPWRLRREILTAFPDKTERRRFVRQQLRTLLHAPLSVSRMAVRARLISAHDRLADCAVLTCPTLIVHGDPALDRVVDPLSSLEYAPLIRRSQTATIERTGHLGSIARPQEFGTIVRLFLEACGQDSRNSAA